jgi:DNA repair protein RecN (Recombination protein N)
MITKLLIENLILVERAELDFSKGFNVLTGETGAGKSAVMAALSFLMGKRSDLQLIRQGAESALVEGHFEAPSNVSSLLEEMGILNDPLDVLVIRRELKVHGKGAVFINQQRVQMHVLQVIGEALITQVSQLAITTLFHPENQLKLLDLFSGIEIKEYREAYFEEKKAERRVDELKKLASSKEIEMCLLEERIKEIEEAHLKEGEEELLFNEYSRLHHNEQIADLINEWHSLFSQEGRGLEELLKRAKKGIDQLIGFDSSLKNLSESVKTALLEVQEVATTLSFYESRLEFSPKRLEEIDERLSLITRLKRQFGGGIEEILKGLKELKERREKLSSLEDELISVRETHSLFEEKRKQLSLELRQKRHIGAQTLSLLMSSELKTLNMPGATFVCELKKGEVTSLGEDLVEFTLSPNKGERALFLRLGASGGEISRVMLALYSLLAEKDNTPILLFDEIDANIGGETAYVVGEKLKEIGRNHQVLCITHFPQTALLASTHFRIRKEECLERTITRIEALDCEGKKEELKRMVGGEVFV